MVTLLRYLLSLLFLVLLNSCTLEARIYDVGSSQKDTTHKNPTDSTSPIYAAPSGLILDSFLQTVDTEPSPTITVSGVTSGLTVRLFSDATCSTQIAVGVANSTSIELIPTSPLADGSYKFYANQGDSSGSSNCSSVSLEYIMDTVPGEISMERFFVATTEGAADTILTVRTSVVKPYDITVGYNINGTTAPAGAHSLNHGTVVIPANQASATILVSTPDNAVAAGPSALQVNLDATSRRSTILGDWTSTKVQIEDDELPSTKMVTQIASYNSLYCTILTDGALWCWGGNSYGQLGDGTIVFRSTPVEIDIGTDYQSIATGSDHTCGVTTAGDLKCWGRNQWSQLGDGTVTNRLLPTDIDGVVTYASVTAGRSHSCGITTASKLKCWGANSINQLGDGTTTTATAPIAIDAASDYQMVSSKETHTCGITTGGVLKCWGANNNGQIGDGTTSTRSTPTVIDSGVNYQAVSAGSSHTCAITIAGVLKCWGRNTVYELGDGTTTQSTLPVIIDAGTNYQFIAAGQYKTCGITSLGALKCWGGSIVGDGTKSSSSTPKVIDPGVAFHAVSVSTNNHVCAVTSARVTRCWADAMTTTYTGVGDLNTSTVAKIINTGDIFVEASGRCARTSTGIIKCLGGYSGGNTDIVGDGAAKIRTSPITIDYGTSYQKLAGGGANSCGITAAGAIKCWGLNTSGQIGDATTTDRLRPVLVDSGVSYVDIDIHRYHTCGVTDAYKLKCWGSNSNGQLGNGTTTNSLVPIEIDSTTDYLKVATGNIHTCAITTANKLKCWGHNGNGQLGDGTTTASLVPIDIDPSSDYKEVSTGDTHTCAITIANKLKCWGNNSSGRLGDGTLVQRLLPVSIDATADYQKVSAGESSTCGIVAITGELKCWGENGNGQLGDGTTTTRTLPVVADSGTNYMSINQTNFTSYLTTGVTADGALKAWGSNQSLKLGTGSLVIFPVALPFGHP